MRFLRSRKSRVGLLCLLMMFTLFHLRKQWMLGKDTSDAQHFPPEGKVTEIDTQGKVPGNPANAVEDMKRLKVFVTTYQRSLGHFPPHIMALYGDITSNPQRYSVGNIEEVRDAFMNPDEIYSDDNDARQHPNTVIPYYIFDKRPNGTLVGSPKAKGTRDILSYTSLYTHRNIRRFKTGVDNINPVGFFVIMWEDGEVEKIPYNKRLYVPTGRDKWSFALPGQAGVPSTALTYRQFNR